MAARRPAASSMYSSPDVSKKHRATPAWDIPLNQARCSGVHQRCWGVETSRWRSPFGDGPSRTRSPLMVAPAPTRAVAIRSSSGANVHDASTSPA